MAEFIAFPKIPRWDKQVIITEKIDGTNACVIVPDDDSPLVAQSRNRIITPESDNFGFAMWVSQHEDELRQLGPGHHYGEWWGVGIQRGYNLSERRFSLFNVGRWRDAEVRPACCHVVPVLWEGTLVEASPHEILRLLGLFGSKAVEGYNNPEGIMIYHTAAKQYFKHLFDPRPKGTL